MQMKGGDLRTSWFLFPWMQCGASLPKDYICSGPNRFYNCCVGLCFFSLAYILATVE